MVYAKGLSRRQRLILGLPNEMTRRMHMTHREVCFWTLAVTISLSMADTRVVAKPTLPTKAKNVRKIVSDGRHNAFAAFVKWQDQYWLAFRKGTGHVARDGDLAVIRSSDTMTWEPSITLDVSGDDRDAQLLATPKRLFLYINSLNGGRFHVSVSHTDDGRAWSKPQPVYRDGFILWKPIQHKGRYYAAAHRPGPNSSRESHLVTSTDGIEWTKVSTIRAGQGESETTLHFGADGRLTAFLRSQVTVGGAILESLPPYAKWTERPAGVHLSGQAVHTFGGVTYLMGRYLGYDPPVPASTPRSQVGGRRLDQATMIYTFESGKLRPYCLLGPLDGNHDSSYAAAVEDGDDMLVVFHRAAHPYAGEFRFKDAADIFLARVPLKPSRADSAEKVSGHTRIVIQGADDVIDGSVSTTNAASFSQPTLKANGYAWSSYETVLMRFKLDRIAPSRHGRLKKAVLRLHVVSAKNPKKKITTVAPTDIAWNHKANFRSPLGNKSTWPVRQEHANINYAMRPGLVSRRVIEKPGVVEFDVTGIVERWLFQDMDNLGLMITASPPIFGQPDQGSWLLAFASTEAKSKYRPALVIDLQGTPPDPAEANKNALALFPSAQLAPVRDPYHFVYYSVGSQKMWKQLPTINMTTYDSFGTWLAPRGVMNLAWADGGPVDWLRTKAAYSTYYTGTARNHPLGFCGHESNLQGEQAGWLSDAFRAAKRSYPDRFLAYYYRGESHMAQLAGEGHVDLLIQEGYTHMYKKIPRKGFAIGMAGIKHRIDMARKHGAIQRHVVMLGHICKSNEYHPGHQLTAEKIDQMIGELRRYAPEMPGIGFYGLGGETLALDCDRLAHKHFVAPAPNVLIQTPMFGQTLTTPHVTIQARATPKDKRKITGYRWFIDNRLVATTKTPEYTWDLRGDHPGHHTVTVHAIDNGWNRAASQIAVRVARP